MNNYLVMYLDKFGKQEVNYIRANSAVEAKKKAYEQLEAVQIFNVDEAYEAKN